MIIFKASGNQLKEMMKPLSLIDDEARLTFTQHSMKSLIVDRGNIVMMNYELPNDVFEIHSLSAADIGKPYGIEFEPWYKIVNMLEKKELCTVSILTEQNGLLIKDPKYTNPQNLETCSINIESEDGFSWSIPLVSPDSIRKEPKIPADVLKNLVSDFNLPTKRFKKILSRSFSEYLTFETTDNEFKTYSEGNISDMQKSRTSIVAKDNIVTPAKTVLLKKHLLNLSKIIKSENIRIHMGKDYPVQIDFAVLSRGSASYLQAPRVDYKD